MRQQITIPDPPFHERIRYYRKERGLTQRQLADLLDTTQDYISDVERGKKPQVTLEWIKRCAKVFGIKTRDLIPRED